MIAACIFLRWAEIGVLHTRLLSVGGIGRRQLSVYVVVYVPPTKSREMLIEIRVSRSSYLTRFRGGALPAQVTSKCLPDWGGFRSTNQAHSNNIELMRPDRSRPEGARRAYFKCPWTSSRIFPFFTRHFVGPKNRRDRAFFFFFNRERDNHSEFLRFFFPTIDNSWSSNSKAQARVHDEKDKTNSQFPIPSLSPYCRINLDRLIQVAVRGCILSLGHGMLSLRLFMNFHFLIPMVSVRIFPFSATHTHARRQNAPHPSLPFQPLKARWEVCSC